jgi:alpha 1,3-glucosidase
LIREAIHTRYALLPYMYTLFKEANVNGSPLMRPLWFEYPEESETFTMEDQFLLGKDLLVHGVYADVSAFKTSLQKPSRLRMVACLLKV